MNTNSHADAAQPKASCYPSRFSDVITLKEANRMLSDASFETPTLPNGSSRLFASIHQELVDGKRSRKGAYVANIFDRAAPWILPRYSKGYVNSSLRVVTADAVGWIEDRLPELQAIADAVNHAIITIQPFSADAARSAIAKATITP